MADDKSVPTIQVKLEQATHRKLKRYAVKNGLLMQRLLDRLVREGLSRERPDSPKNSERERAKDDE